MDIQTSAKYVVHYFQRISDILSLSSSLDLSQKNIFVTYRRIVFKFRFKEVICYAGNLITVIFKSGLTTCIQYQEQIEYLILFYFIPVKINIFCLSINVIYNCTVQPNLKFQFIQLPCATDSDWIYMLVDLIITDCIVKRKTT